MMRTLWLGSIPAFFLVNSLIPACTYVPPTPANASSAGSAGDGGTSSASIGASSGGNGGSAGAGMGGSGGAGNGGSAGAGMGGSGGATSISLDWVTFSGGEFSMGSLASSAEQPEHLVTIAGFDLTRAEITVAEYMQCVNAGACLKPQSWSTNCYWSKVGFDNHPVNCVTWEYASGFCTWTGGRLPSEAEWEYAARSAGQAKTYPWGEDPPTCDLTVDASCGLSIPNPVCSKSNGNTADGLCDMAGNVFEWVQDGWHGSYVDAPVDGSAWEGGNTRVVRGGAFNSNPNQTRTSWRFIPYDKTYNNLFLGFRCAR